MCPKRNDENVIRFFKHVREHTREHNIRFVITRGSEVNIGYGVGRASGIFNEHAIRVAGDNYFSDVLATVVHEYCHFLQFINNEEVWVKATRIDSDEALNDKTVTDEKFARLLELDKHLEIDAEKKAVVLIKKWDLPIDIDDYIKKANAYIYYYVYMMKHRKWCKNAPNAMPSILDLMPSKFRRSYNKLPDEYEKLVNRYCV